MSEKLSHSTTPPTTSSRGSSIRASLSRARSRAREAATTVSGIVSNSGSGGGSSSSTSHSLPPPESLSIIDAAPPYISALEDLVRAEGAVAVSDYNLVVSLNNSLTERYKGAALEANNASSDLRDVRSAHGELAPVLGEIGSLHESLDSLLEAVRGLDAYSKRLEVALIKSASR